MKSLRNSLAKVGIKPPFSVPSGFQTHPKRLKEMIRIMNLPEPDINALQHRKVCDFAENDAQGLTYAYGNIWFLSSTENIFKYSIEGTDLYNPDKVCRLKKKSLSDLNRETDLDKQFCHCSDIDYFDGLTFVIVRYGGDDPPYLLLALSENLEVVGYSWLSPETGDSWCAISPWNGLLYTPSDQNAHLLIPYDVSEFYKVLPYPHKWGKRVNINLKEKGFILRKEDGSLDDEVNSHQGIAFSQNGRLYITRYNGNGPWYNYIHIYNALTGVRLGVSEEYDFPDFWDEIEGISIHPTGIIYIAVAINQNIFTDRFQIYGFKYPDSSPV
ncbi:MAG: hypothetical protein IMF11_01335 [Proteobacteria bacterium]|nr:hypothetical protein [Pseudomonadota bacterium]